MNIFYFDEDPWHAAKMQPDKMLVKMVLETVQILSTAHRVLDADDAENSLYKATHINHPCTVWARESSGNYEWLLKHFMALCAEYHYRYEKHHASYNKLAFSLSYLPENIAVGSMTPVALAMPDKYKQDDPVAAYRNYCIHEKEYAAWNNKRKKPTWWEH